MKTKLIISIFMLFLTIALGATSLELSIAKNECYQNDFIRATLELKGIMISPDPLLEKNHKALSYKDSKTPTLKYDFKIHATELGEQIVGPYKIVFEGKEFTSNTIKLTVIESLAAKLRESLNNPGVLELKKGEEFIVSVVTDKVAPDLEILSHNMFKLKAKGQSSSSRISNWKLKKKYIYKYTLIATQDGTLRLSPSLFDLFPENAVILHRKFVE